VVIKPLLFAIHGSSCPHHWRWAVSKKCKYSFQLLVPHRHKSVFSLLNGTYSAKIWKCPVNVKGNRTWSFATYQVLCDSKRLKVMTQTLCNSQGCCLTGARSPGAPKLCMRATKFLYKEPARAPINLRLSWDNGPYFPINLVLLAELQTVELFMYLAWRHTWWNFSQTRNKSVQQRRFAKPSFVPCWQLETEYKMRFPNMEYQNHGLFCCPRHSQVITRWRQRRLLGRFDIYLFLFVRRTGR